MNKERNCQECIHHISGECSKWNCEMQTLEDYRNKVIDEFMEQIKELFKYESAWYKTWIDKIAEQIKANKG